MVLRASFLLVFLALTGCSVNTAFVYKPAEPISGGQKLPVKIAVLPFEDGTEDFTKRGNELFDQENLKYNLAKTGISSLMTALTPELWAKALADDMAASGIFTSVRFVYGPSELVDEDFYIKGTLEKAYFGGTWDKPNEFTLSLQALRKADNQLIWEKVSARSWKDTPAMYNGCGVSMQCAADHFHAKVNLMMQSLLVEARTDLVNTLAPLSGNRVEAGALQAVKPSAQPTRESVDETIERILDGK
ncbi:MAG: hypothetical protein PHP95_05735 [Desulfuromonadaceae bacterium]|nr:hypothetical protein [Desulfuromonadaceae bacterium]MDD2847941.1 hypothetical protein [Desulfuromonadaceae bacterium]MDD4131317.1 hypothetical protein [Desulfuromonadaceae bacterium]